MAPPDDRLRHLSVHRSFVVQFYSNADLSSGTVAGRIEHIVSGQVTLFDSLEDLIAFIDIVLRELPERPCEETEA